MIKPNQMTATTNLDDLTSIHFCDSTFYAIKAVANCDLEDGRMDAVQDAILVVQDHNPGEEVFESILFGGYDMPTCEADAADLLNNATEWENCFFRCAEDEIFYGEACPESMPGCDHEED